MTHDFKPGQLVKYVGTLEDSRRRPGDVARLDHLIHEGFWQGTILRTGGTLRTTPRYIEPIGDQDDGNP